MKKVYIVHCIDTEGPMDETLEETFLRVKKITGFEITPSLQNLKKLQEEKFNLNGKEKIISNIVKPERIKMNRNWKEINKMLHNIQSTDFRNEIVDSLGNGWIYNWFCLDHVNMKGENPRKRDIGHHKVFDFYKQKTEIDNNKDYISWHFHPIPYTQNYHNNGVAYLNSNNIWDILSRKIIERNWFPSTYRPGFHTIRPDSNWFLEQWIPFDFSNQSTPNEGNQPDLTDGRCGDWRRAPKSWKPYNPSMRDYQVPGECKRWIFRCLNMEARLREINQKDFDDAFNEANSGNPIALSFTNHDFRDMTDEIYKMRGFLKKSMKKYPNVEIEFSNALNAARKVLNLKPQKIDLDLQIIEEKSESMKIKVTSKSNIFGPQPYLAIKTTKNEFIWENFDNSININEWFFCFDYMHIPKNLVEKIGIAANSNDGTTEVINYDLKSKKLEKFIHNYE